MNLFKNSHLLLPALLATTISSVTLADVSETIEKTFEFEPNGKIQLSNINGDVSISACDCSQVSLTAKITASSQAVRDRILIDINDSTDHLTIKTKYSKQQQRSLNNQYSEVNYLLTVPKGVALDSIDLVNGDLVVKGVSGSLKANLVNGELTSDGHTSTTQVDMVNGDMTLRFENLNHAENISLKSVNGAIKLYLPTDAGAQVNAETVSGKISNDFGIKVIKHKYVGSEMQGKIGSGNTTVYLNTVNGKIALKAG
jgi:hypothetical protein